MDIQTALEIEEDQTFRIETVDGTGRKFEVTDVSQLDYSGAVLLSVTYPQKRKDGSVRVEEGGKVWYQPTLKQQMEFVTSIEKVGGFDDEPEDDIDDEDTDSDFELPSDEKIRLIQGITRVAHTPKIVEGKISKSGKTISVDADNRSLRLDTEKILKGGTEIRNAATFRLYSPEKYNTARRSNTNPATGQTHAETDCSDLPEVTHEKRSE